MSEVDYNNLLYEISKRLDERNVVEQLRAMCRRKVASSSEENMQAFSLFEELEAKGLLGPDRLDVLKDLLKGVKEWSLFEEVEKFESKRKEYNELLEQIIRVLDELNDLERLIAMCREKIAEDKLGNVHDVRSLFKELENNDCLGINHLGILKEILTQTEKSNLLKEVEEFEQRRSREHKFERRKAQAAAIASSVGNKLSGVMNIKTVFKVVAGGITVASSLELLTRGSTYDQLIAAVSTCVLPVGANLIQITEGCVCLTVQAENLSALNTLWSLYKGGKLKACLQALFVSDEMRERAGGEQVEVIVTMDEQEYEKARNELTNEAQEGRDGREDELVKYLHQDKLSYIQGYLEKAEDIDAYSITTETSDSGMPGSHGAPSEFGMEETSDSTSKLCLKDLSKAVTGEVTIRLESDKVALERFYKSYGLDPKKFQRERLRKISEFFPDTPVKVLKDVFEALQLYDLVELLEKVKPRTLRPAFPLKEIEKLPNASNRPTKFYTKAEVLIIDYTSSTLGLNTERIGSFFKEFNSRSELTTLTAKPTTEVFREIETLRQVLEKEDMFREMREKELKELLEKKKPKHTGTARERSVHEEDLPAMKKELEELMENREKWAKERKPMIEKAIKQKKKELKKAENEEFKMAVSTVLDNWIQHAQDEGEESTLFVVLSKYFFGDLDRMVERCLKEKLAFIPNTKLVITAGILTSWSENEEIPLETLHVDYSDCWQTGIVLATMFELLKKRWQKLDLISVMLELQRTLAIKLTSQYQLVEGGVSRWESEAVQIQENLSCLPKLQKNEKN